MKKFLTTALAVLIFCISTQMVFSAETVSLNQQTLKYHNSTCRYYNCKSCIKLSKEKALKKGGKPCKACGG